MNAVNNNLLISTYPEKITRCVQEALGFCYRILAELGHYLLLAATFPFRYVGSKFLTLPELLIRVVTLMKQIIFCEEKSSRIKLSETGYSFQAQDLPPERYAEAEKYARFYAAAHSVSNDPAEGSKRDPKGWLPPSCTLREVYTENDVKMVLIDEGNTVHVVFGAIGAEGVEESEGRHLRSALFNLWGFLPKIYLQAEQLYKAYEKEFEGKEIRFSRQCLGGSLAAFVALKTGKQAFCLNTLAWGVGVQSHLGRSLLSQAKNLITHVNVSGDLISAPLAPLPPLDFLLNFCGLRTPGNWGNRYSIPHPSEYNYNFDAIHRLILGSLIALQGGPVFGRGEGMGEAQKYLIQRDQQNRSS